MKVERKIFACPKSQATWKNLSKVPEILGQIGKIYIQVAPKNPQCLHPFLVLSQVKRLQCNNIRSSWEHKGDNFNLLKSRSQINLLIPCELDPKSRKNEDI